MSVNIPNIDPMGKGFSIPGTTEEHRLWLQSTGFFDDVMTSIEEFL